MRAEHSRDQNKRLGVGVGWGRVDRVVVGWERRKDKMGRPLLKVSSCLEAVAAVEKCRGSLVAAEGGPVVED